MKKLISITKNNGTNKGYCNECGKFFRKDDFIITFERARVDVIIKTKMCVKCLLCTLAEVVGWKKLSATILKIVEEKI